MAKQGDAVAQYILAEQYAGLEGPENHKSAVILFKSLLNEDMLQFSGDWNTIL